MNGIIRAIVKHERGVAGMIRAINDFYHRNAPLMRRLGAWLGCGLLLLAGVLAAIPDVGIGHIVIEVMTWLGGALGGAVLVPEAQRSLIRWVAGGGSVVLIATSQAVVAHWPAEPVAGIIAAVLTGLAGLAKGGALVRRPDEARASIVPTSE